MDNYKDNQFEINNIAYEYGEYAANCLDYDMYYDPELRHKLVAKGNSEFAQHVLEWLSTRYCLVEKNHVEEEYKSSKHCFENTDSSNPTQKQYFWGRMCAIESLFLEIAKKV